MELRLSSEADEAVAELMPAQQLSAKEDGRTVLLDVGAIDYIEAAGNYACVHVAEQTHVLRETMAHLQERLTSGPFLRIHRSTLVNASRILALEPSANGPCQVRLRSGDRLEMSRRSRSKLQPLLRQLGLV